MGIVMDAVVKAYNERKPISGLYVLPVRDTSRLEGLSRYRRKLTGDMPCWSPLVGKFHVKREWLPR